jgi:hypothetical protein
MSLAREGGQVRRLTGDRLKPADVQAIVAGLEGWRKPKITWSMVVSAVAEDWLNPRRFSRQALEAKPKICRAYHRTKERLRKGLPPEKRKPLTERVATLQSENVNLRAQNDALLETFVTWMLNAKDRGVRVDQLEAALLPARLPSDYREAEITRLEAERAEGLEKLKRLVARKTEKRLAL